jgi:hypothetical protein
MSSGLDLFRLASGRRYDRIPAHVQEHPDDVLWQDIYGSTALHSLCIAQKMHDDALLLDAVDAILAQAPHLVGKPNDSSWTPLHMACDRRVLWRNTVSTERLVLKLLDAFPEAVSIPLSNNCFHTKTPFHIACENNASIAVLRRMLRLDPSLATRSLIKCEQHTLSSTPLQELWKSINGSSQGGGGGGEEEEDMSKMELVLKAAFAGSIDVKDSEFHVLCAACSMRCPRDYISLIIRDQPELIRQPDKDGLLPLHYAVRSADVKSPYATDYILERLLEEYPEAAGIPFSEEDDDISVLPLHFLISDRGSTCLSGGVLTLIKARPETLRTPDPRSGLVPVLASAETAALNRMHLSTTYEMLRAAPDVIQRH